MIFNKKISTYFSFKLYAASLGEKFQLKLVKTLAIKNILMHKFIILHKYKLFVVSFQDKKIYL